MHFLTIFCRLYLCRIAFVEYGSEGEAAAAIEAYNESDIDGRSIGVSLAGARTDKQTTDHGNNFSLAVFWYAWL